MLVKISISKTFLLLLLIYFIAIIEFLLLGYFEYIFYKTFAKKTYFFLNYAHVI